MNSDGTAPMCASPGCEVFRSPIADGPAPVGWRCSRHEKPASWLDDPLATFDQYPDARAYIVASDVFPRVQKALQERYGPNMSDRHFRGTPVVPSAHLSPGTYMIASNEETLNAYVHGWPFAERMWEFADPTAGLDDDMARAFASWPITDPIAALFDLQRQVRSDARNGAGEVAGLAERVAKLEARLAEVEGEGVQFFCAGCNATFDTQDDGAQHVECLIHTTTERLDEHEQSVGADVQEIKKRLDVLDQIRRNEYPWSDVMSDPACFQPIWPMLEKAMVAAAAVESKNHREELDAILAKAKARAGPAEAAEVASAAFEREAAEWKRRHADALGKRMAESERIAVAKSARAEPTYTGWPVVTCARWSAGRLFRARRWVNAHWRVSSVLASAAFGGAAARVLTVLFL